MHPTLTPTKKASRPTQFIYAKKDKRPSWPWCWLLYWYGLPVHQQSPIHVVITK